MDEMDGTDDDDDDDEESPTEDDAKQQKKLKRGVDSSHIQSGHSIVHADMIFYCFEILGNYLFSGSNDQQILVWSLQTNTVLTNLQGHEGWIKSLTGTKSTLFSGSHDETIRVWDLNSLQCKHTLKAKDKVEALLATPQALVSASGDYMEIWDNNTYTLASSTNARTSILALARHGSRVFCGSIGNHLKVWSCD